MNYTLGKIHVSKRRTVEVCVCVCVLTASLIIFVKVINYFSVKRVETSALAPLIGLRDETHGTVMNCIKNTFLTLWNLELRTLHVPSPKISRLFFAFPRFSLSVSEK